MNARWKKSLSLAVLFTLALTVFFRAMPSALALTLAPVRYEVTTDAGTSVGSEMVLINDQAETKTFYASYANFEAEGDTGTPKFTDSDTGLATWISTISTVTLGPGESQKVPFTITVPAGTAPGGYFSTIFWSTNPPAAEGAGEVAIGAKVGMLVLLTVAGDVSEQGGIHDFMTSGKQFFYRALPVSFEYRFSNDGADRVKPAGSIVIRSILGWRSASILANPADGNVLPHSTRKFISVWTKHVSAQPEIADGYSFTRALKDEWRNFAFGIYTAKLEATFGASGTAVSSRASYFAVIPVELLGLVILVFGGGYFLVRSLLRSYRRKIEKVVQARMSASSKSDI